MKKTYFLLPGLFLFVSASCKETEKAIDCNGICQRYADCYDSSYDVSACASECRDEATHNEADACKDCLDDEDSCTAQTFNCTDECANVLISAS